MAIASIFQRDLAPKHPVHHDEKSKREAHAEGPPYQAYVQCMRTGEGLLDRDVATGVSARRQ